MTKQDKRILKINVKSARTFVFFVSFFLFFFFLHAPATLVVSALLFLLSPDVLFQGLYYTLINVSVTLLIYYFLNYLVLVILNTVQ